MAVMKLSKGGTIRTFAPSPAGFNPLQADQRALLVHGFPPRPADSELLKRWERAVSRPLRSIQPTFRRMDYKRHRLPDPDHPKDAHGTETTSIWSGAVVYAPNGATMKWVEGEWTVPNAFPPAGPADGVWYSASTWIGIDGDGSPDVLQAGCDSDVMISGGVIQRQLNPWWEWYPEDTFWISNFPVNQGDTLECLICVDQNSTTAAHIYLVNQTSGARTSFAVTAPSGTSLIGNCAEWILESLEIDTLSPELASYGDVYFNAAYAGTVDNTVLHASAGNVINMTDSQNNLISSGNIENSRLVRCTYEGLP